MSPIKTRNLSLYERMNLYKKVKQLRREKNWGRWRIGDYLNISRNTVGGWLYKNMRPDRQPSDLSNVDLSSSPSLAYIIGVCYGDGTAYESRNRGIVQLAATDKEFVAEFRRCLLDIVTPRYGGNLPISCTRRPDRKDIFSVTVISRRLYEFLNSGLGSHNDCIEKYPEGFIKGVFDSEGCVSHIRTKQGSYRNVVVCTNSNKELLEYMQALLGKIGIKGRIYPKGAGGSLDGYKFTKPCYDLEIGSRANLIAFNDKISFTIERKKKILEQIVESYS